MKITDIRVTPLVLTFKEPLHWADRVDTGGAAVLVEVETNEGIVGIGESTAGIPAESVVNCLLSTGSLWMTWCRMRK